MRLLAVALLLGFSGPAWTQTTSAQASVIRTLADAYSRARAVSETVAISEQAVVQAEALYRKAFGAAFPEFSLQSKTFWQDVRPIQGGTDAGVRLLQSNLTFYRELYSIKQSKATERQREQDLARAEQGLLVTVAAAFFGLLQARENVANTAHLKELSEKRVAELKERVRVGRNREADVVAQQVQIEGLESQLEESGRQAAALTDLLVFLTRVPAIDPQVPPPLKPETKPLEHYLSKIDARPDVGSALKAAEAAADAVHVARADRFPQVGLLGNYYRYRPLARENIEWDATLTVGLPIWSFGARAAAVDSARAFRVAQDLALQLARRFADLDIKNAFRDLASSMRQLDIQNHAAELAVRDYELQLRDERRTLVTNIEVLDSLDRLNNARLALTRALFTARLDAIDLELAAGGRPAEMDLR